jgi:hypothetical protein
VRGQIDPKSRVRRLTQVDLWEISIVTFPLLNGARVSPQGAISAAHCADPVLSLAMAHQRGFSAHGLRGSGAMRFACCALRSGVCLETAAGRAFARPFADPPYGLYTRNVIVPP